MAKKSKSKKKQIEMAVYDPGSGDHFSPCAS